LTPSPIVKVLSTIQKSRVRYLMMGGQACIIYGAAEFSRDLDVAVLADAINLERLHHALDQLKAEPVYVPNMDIEVLRRGHACHFRTNLPEVDGMRIDVMSVLHGCDAFPKLWKRRQRVQLPGNGWVNLLSLPDLVTAKKTQRDKDWPMVRRLVEINYHQRSARPAARQIEFWFREGRSAEFLIELCQRYPKPARRWSSIRPLLQFAENQDAAKTEQELRREEDELRAVDRAYWQPLKAELFRWRQERRS